MPANHSRNYALNLDLQTFAEDPVVDPVITPNDVQPGDDPAVSDPPVIDSPTTNNDPQPEGEFDTIKYNGEEMQIPVSERQNYLQKGYHYDEVRSERDALKEQTERLARLSGYESTDQFLQALDGFEQQLTMQQEAQRMGLNVEDYQQFIAPTNQKVTKLESELNELRELKLDMQLNELGIEDKDLRDKVKEMVSTKGYDIQDAYKVATYDLVGKSKEQEVLANVAKRNNNQVLPGKDQPSNLQFDPSNMSLSDIEKLSERVQRGERIEL